MKKQPYLTGFPKYILATAKRKKQAAISKIRTGLQQSSLSGYAVLFSDIISSDFLNGIDETKRKRLYGNIPIFWAWLAQILEQNSSCSRGLGLIQSWYQALNLPAPTGDTSAYCKARKKLSLDFLKAVFDRVNTRLDALVTDADRWHGFTLKAIDGSSVQLMDTAKNQEIYPQHTSQKPGCGFPTMGVAGLVNLSSGGWINFIPHSWNVGDAKMANQCLSYLNEDDLLLADRAYCSFELIAKITIQGNSNVLFRLHQRRHEHLDWDEGEKINDYERIVTWTKPTNQPKGSELTKEEWKALPKTIKVRLIKALFEARDGTMKELVVVTNLLDHTKYDGFELLDLYARRWDIEVQFRDVKTTMKMEFFAVKTPEMAHKTLYVMMIAYNLLRYLMKKAAVEAEKPAYHMSFKATMDLVTSSHERFREVASTPRKKQEKYDELITTLATKTLCIRPFRLEPRAIKRRPKNFQLLTEHRSVFKEIPHRNSYRKSA